MNCQDKIDHGVCPLGGQFKSLRDRVDRAERMERREIRDLQKEVEDLRARLADELRTTAQLRSDLKEVEDDALEFLRGCEAYQKGHDSARAFRDSSFGRRLALGGTRTQERNPNPMRPRVLTMEMPCPDCGVPMFTLTTYREVFAPSFRGMLRCGSCAMEVEYPAGVDPSYAPQDEVRVLVPGSRRLRVG